MAPVNRIQRYLLALLLTALPFQALALKHSSLAEYTAHLQDLHALIERCQANAAACDPALVGDDEQVKLDSLGSGANVNEFEVRYDWLRKAIKAASDWKASGRHANLDAAAARIDDALREAGTTPGGVPFADARHKADAILRHPEFATVADQSVWEKILARFFLWLDSLFNHVASFGRRSPWIAPLLEWGLIALALAGLLLWAMRMLQRQRLAVRTEATRQIEPWEEASRNWRNLAEEQAVKQDWREAIHCLYWASIVMLEGRRFWSPNRSRTPREYVALLEPGSQRWSLLHQQTRGFERIWYGLNPADATDYRNALELHEQLRAA
jgi:Domain of unknown function (DUF4129)